MKHIDFNILGLLAGMMMMVGITAETGLFSYVAVKAAKLAKGKPKKILMALFIITAMASAFLDNVTTVLLMVPITFSITRQLRINPLPFLLSQIIASNVGGTATLIGDPPNIMIGSAVKELMLMAFISNLALVILIIIVAYLPLLLMMFGKQMKTSPELQHSILEMDEGRLPHHFYEIFEGWLSADAALDCHLQRVYLSKISDLIVKRMSRSLYSPPQNAAMR